MKKLLLLCVCAIALSSCKQQINTPPNTEQVSNEIVYFKDYKTGLCFAVVNSITYYEYNVTSITCVPCDSLKKINLK